MIEHDAANPDVEAQGATLGASSAITNSAGVVTVDVHAGSKAVFHLIATAGNAKPADLTVSVTDGEVGDVIVAPFLDPDSMAAANTIGIGGIEVRFFDRMACADINLVDPPFPLRNPNLSNPPPVLPVAGGSCRFDKVSTTESSAVVGRALSARVNTVAIAVGCVDLPGPSLLADGVVEVALPLRDPVINPVGTYAVTTSLQFVPPLDASAAIARAWRDLGDCPLDPAQLTLDCIVDALSPASPSDPLDCKPSPSAGGEGALGAALMARRGKPIVDFAGTVTSCRDAADATGAPSLDAITFGLFGNPIPPLVVALPAIGDAAVHVLDDVELSSTLDVRSAGPPGQYLITHTLDGASFAPSMSMMGDPPAVLLAPLALPVLTAYSTATTADHTLLIDRHGFTLRLGRVARAGFGATTLAAQGVAPPDAGGLIAALAALARSPDGTASGCAALDRVLCAAVGVAGGCLAAACPAGLSALAGRLDAAFDAADGTDLDFTLSGAAPMIDTLNNFSAYWLGEPPNYKVPEGQTPAIARWSVDLRTAGGGAQLMASFCGMRSSSQ